MGLRPLYPCRVGRKIGRTTLWACGPSLRTPSEEPTACGGRLRNRR